MLQRFAIVVKRESDMLRLTLGFQLLQEFPAIDAVEQFDVILVDGVEPVVVEILQPSSSELNVEHPLQIVVGGDFCCGHLVGHGVAFARVSLHNRLTHKHLAFASVVHERRVEVGEATRHIFVHHLGGKLVVNRLLVVGVEKGKTHHSQAEFSHAFSYSFSYFLRTNLMNAQPPIT